jgi:hypothetical protein
MASIINASPSNGIVQTADGSGILKIQSNSVTTNALAWVNFNGTSGASPVIRASYNISSVTRNSTGYYSVAFTNSTTDVNYSPSVSVAPNAATGSFVNIFDNGSFSSVAPTTSGFNIGIYSYTSAAYKDVSYVCVSVFGN